MGLAAGFIQERSTPFCFARRTYAAELSHHQVQIALFRLRTEGCVVLMISLRFTLRCGFTELLLVLQFRCLCVRVFSNPLTMWSAGRIRSETACILCKQSAARYSRSLSNKKAIYILCNIG